MSSLLSSFSGRRFTRLDSETVEMYHVARCVSCGTEVKLDPIITREVNDSTLTSSGLIHRAIAPTSGTRPWVGADATCAHCKVFQ